MSSQVKHKPKCAKLGNNCVKSDTMRDKLAHNCVKSGTANDTGNASRPIRKNEITFRRLLFAEETGQWYGVVVNQCQLCSQNTKQHNIAIRRKVTYQFSLIGS